MQVGEVCCELGITVPVAVHADHYGIQSGRDVETAKIETPSMFDDGITSIAIDGSHLPDLDNTKRPLSSSKKSGRWLSKIGSTVW